MNLREIYSILFDSTEYYIEYNNGIIEEGYKGYELREGKNSNIFVIYKNIDKKDRKFGIPCNRLKLFQKKYDYFQNFFNKQMFLIHLTQEIRKIYEEKVLNEIAIEVDVLLKKLCDEKYSLEKNYICFVALDLTKSHFFNFVKNELKKQKVLM